MTPQPVPMSITSGGGIPAPRFGDFQLLQSACKTGRKFIDIADITPAMKGQNVWIRARKYSSRAQSKKLVFVTLRQQFHTIQCVCAAGGDISVQMSTFIANCPNESVVDVLAKVNVAEKPILSCTTQNIELSVEAFLTVSRSESRLPLQVVDAARSQADIDDAIAKNPQAAFVQVNIDTRLNNRMIDLRTPANQAIMRLNSAVGQVTSGSRTAHAPTVLRVTSH